MSGTSDPVFTILKPSIKMLEGIDKENWYWAVEIFSDLLQWQS